MKKLLLFIICVSVMIFAKIEYRRFYKVDEVTFTVWKRLGGNCFIMPYKYYGLIAPKSDYILASNRGAISIFVNTDSSFVIYNEAYDLKEKICFNLPNYKWKFIEYPYNKGIDSVNNYAKNQYELRKHLSYIYINIQEMHTEISDNK